MRIRSRNLPIAAVLLLAGCGPRVPSVTLAVDKKLNATFGAVSDVVEIAGGRVAFADPMARRFHTGDFATGSVDTIGVPVDSLPYNAPPSLYRHPGWVAQLAGDTVAVVDFGATRTTLWTPAGFARVLAIPEAGGPTPVLVYDTLGHGYKVDFRSVTGGAEPGVVMRNDSLPVLRMNFATGGVDTIARLSVPEFGEAKFGPQVQTVAHIFGPADVFGVLPDGTIWVARARRHLDPRSGAQLREGDGDGRGQEAGDGPAPCAWHAEQRGGGVPLREDEAVVRGRSRPSRRRGVAAVQPGRRS
jgi:hypothetical protein